MHRKNIHSTVPFVLITISTIALLFSLNPLTTSRYAIFNQMHSDQDYDFLIFLNIAMFTSLTSLIFVISNIKPSHGMPVYNIILSIHNIHLYIAFLGVLLLFLYTAKNYYDMYVSIIMSSILTIYGIYISITCILTTIELTINARKYFNRMIPYFRNKFSVIDNAIENARKTAENLRKKSFPHMLHNVPYYGTNMQYISVFEVMADRAFYVKPDDIVAQFEKLAERVRKECEEKNLLVASLVVPGFQYYENNTPIVVVYAERSIDISVKMIGSINKYVNKVLKYDLHTYADEYQYLTLPYYRSLKNEALHDNRSSYLVTLRQLYRAHQSKGLTFTKEMFLVNMCEFLEESVRKERRNTIEPLVDLLSKELIPYSIRENDFKTCRKAMNLLLEINVRHPEKAVKIEASIQNLLYYIDSYITIKKDSEAKKILAQIAINAVERYMYSAIINQFNHERINIALRYLIWRSSGRSSTEYNGYLVKSLLILISRALRQGELTGEFDEQKLVIDKLVKIIEPKGVYANSLELVNVEQAYQIISDCSVLLDTLITNGLRISNSISEIEDLVPAMGYMLYALNILIEKKLVSNANIKTAYGGVFYDYDKIKYKEIQSEYDEILSLESSSELIQEHIKQIKQAIDKSKQDNVIRAGIETMEFRKYIKEIITEDIQSFDRVCRMRSKLVLSTESESIEVIYRMPKKLITQVITYRNLIRKPIINGIMQALTKEVVERNSSVDSYQKLSSVNDTQYIIGFAKLDQRELVQGMKSKLVFVKDIDETELFVLNDQISIDPSIRIRVRKLEQEQAYQEVAEKTALYQSIYGYLDMADKERIEELVREVVLELKISYNGTQVKKIRMPDDSVIK